MAKRLYLIDVLESSEDLTTMITDVLISAIVSAVEHKVQEL